MQVYKYVASLIPPRLLLLRLKFSPSPPPPINTHMKRRRKTKLCFFFVSRYFFLGRIWEEKVRKTIVSPPPLLTSFLSWMRMDWGAPLNLFLSLPHFFLREGRERRFFLFLSPLSLSLRKVQIVVASNVFCQSESIGTISLTISIDISSLHKGKRD